MDFQTFFEKYRFEIMDMSKSIMAHDITTPLDSIMRAIEIIVKRDGL